MEQRDRLLPCTSWEDPTQRCPLFDPDAGCCTRPSGGCYGSLRNAALESPESLGLFLQFHNLPKERTRVC